MCKYCNNNSVLMQQDIDVICGIGDIGKGGYISRDTLYVKYDARGYLRLVNEDDNCLDHGKKIKVNYCFHCGRRI